MIEKRFNLGMKGSLIKSLLQRLLPGGDVDAAFTSVNASLSNKANIPQAIPNNTDLNECRTAGMYYVGSNGTSALNTPTATSAFSLFVEKNNAWGDGVKQTFTPFTSPEIYCRVYYNGTWSRWDLVATATPPQEYDLPLAAGIAQYNPCKYRKNQESEVKTHIRIGYTSLSAGTVIATLPAGYRPGYVVSVLADIVFDDTVIAAHVDANPNGNIIIFPHGTVPKGGYVVVEDFCFVAAA